MWYYDEETGDYYFVAALNWRVVVIDQIPTEEDTFPRWYYLINDDTSNVTPLTTLGGVYTALDMAEEIIEHHEELVRSL